MSLHVGNSLPVLGSLADPNPGRAHCARNVPVAVPISRRVSRSSPERQAHAAPWLGTPLDSSRTLTFPFLSQMPRPSEEAAVRAQPVCRALDDQGGRPCRAGAAGARDQAVPALVIAVSILDARNSASEARRLAMARTRLLRAIERLAAEHHEAEQLAIPPAELRERRAEAVHSRREILKRGGALGVAAIIGPSILVRPAVAAAATLRASRSSAAGSPGSTRRSRSQTRGSPRRSTRRPTGSAAGCTPTRAATGPTARSASGAAS